MKKILTFSIRYTVPFIALGISTFVAIRSCSQDNYLRENKYMIDALSHRPVLKLINEFRIDSIIIIDTLSLVSPSPESLYFYQPGESKTSPLIFEGNFAIHATITLQNTGSDIASIRSQTILTKKTTDTVIRDYILTGEKDRARWLYDSTDYYFKYIDIAPGDSFSFKIPVILRNITDPNETVIHMLFLYQNSAEFLFDTYCWFKLVNKPIPNPQILIAKTSKQIRIIMPRDYIEKCFEVSESNCAYYSYDSKENGKVTAFLKNSCNK